jgi:hypothetical protein
MSSESGGQRDGIFTKTKEVMTAKTLQEDVHSQPTGLSMPG